MALLTKKWIFSFLASLVATLGVGFFVWNIFVMPENGIFSKVLSNTESDALEYLSASISQGYDNESMDLAGLGAEELADEDLDSEEGPVPLPQSLQDQLDDIQEKIDLISQQVAGLLADSRPPDEVEDSKEEQDESLDEKNDENQQEELEVDEESAENESTTEENTCLGGANINTASEQDLEKIIDVGPVTAQKIIDARPFCSLDDLLRVSGIGEKTLQEIKNQGCAYVESGICSSPVVSGGGGGSAPVVYPKILISEVQVAGESDDKQEFVELYNPNNSDIDLTNWFLQRKTATGSSWATYAPKTLFSGKSILANGYFLIARMGYCTESADTFTDNPITDNNSFVFKNPNGEISDKLGFGLALDFESLATVSPGNGQSIGRKILPDGTEQDTDDNSVDFEIDTPTPKAQNIAYVESPVPELGSIEITTPATKLIYTVGDALDISGLVVTGNYSDGSTQIEPVIESDISGFDSSAAVAGQVLTITIGGFTITYTIDINEPADTPPPVDATPPIGTITINNGAEYTNSRDVILSLHAEDDLSEVVEMNIANASSYHGWEPYVDSKEWQLPVTNGVKTVRVKFKDSAGNENSPGIPDTIILDTIVPVITLNGDSTVNLFVGDDYKELGATIEDANISNDALVIGGDLADTSTANTFQITYDAEDLAGNGAVQVIRTVVVSNNAD